MSPVMSLSKQEQSTYKCICEPHGKQTIIILLFVFQLISDAGYQGEITSVSTACHQIEVFSRVLKTSVCSFLEEGEQTIDNNLPEFSVSLFHKVHFMSVRVCTRLNIHLLLLLFLFVNRKWFVMDSTHTFMHSAC